MQHTSTKQTLREFPLQSNSLLYVSPYPWSGKSMPAQPKCLHYPVHCSASTPSTASLEPVWWNCGYFCVDSADVLMWHLDNTWDLKGWFLAWCLSFGWCCYSQVRCSFWLTRSQDSCICRIEWSIHREITAGACSNKICFEILPIKFEVLSLSFQIF